MSGGAAVVVSPAPALDRTLRVGTLRRGAVHRPDWAGERAGGKGANVVRTLNRRGVPATLVTALGGVQGHAVRELARAEGMRLVDSGTPVPTRVCTTVVDEAEATSFYERPGPMPPATWNALLAAVGGLLPAPVLVITGSLPDGLPRTAPADLVAAADLAGTPVWADVGGPALTTLAGLGAVVWPNLFEARQALGTESGDEPVHGDLGGPEAGREAARALVGLGAAAAVVSCGADGVAVALRDGTAAHVPAVPVTVVNPVGAGDVLLGATLAHLCAGAGTGQGLIGLVEAVAHGVAAASRSCTSVTVGEADQEAGAVHG